jgi:mannose-6-phosphate isomerase-like protein (cupin superfamily)
MNEFDKPPAAPNVEAAFATRRIAAAPDAIAPDGSEVRLLCATARGSMAVFTLAPGAVSRAVAHRTVEEIWRVVAGSGRLWRQLGGEEAVTDLIPGTSVTLPAGARFQFRCDGEAPLSIVGVTMPPWPGDGEAYAVDGLWAPTV